MSEIQKIFNMKNILIVGLIICVGVTILSLGDKKEVDTEEIALVSNLKENNTPYISYIDISKQNTETKKMTNQTISKLTMKKVKGTDYYNFTIYVPNNYEIKIIGDNEDIYPLGKISIED